MDAVSVNWYHEAAKAKSLRYSTALWYHICQYYHHRKWTNVQNLYQWNAEVICLIRRNQSDLNLPHSCVWHGKLL